MKLSKKKIQEINMISHVNDVLRGCCHDSRLNGNGTHMVDCPPDMWEKDFARNWDMMNELEMRLKRDILKALGHEE